MHDGLALYNDLSAEDLIVFDLDNTLIKSKSPIKRVPLDKRLHILMDERLPELFLSLHQKKIRLLGLTHAHTGSYKTVADMEEWRYTHTKKLGLFFTNYDNPEKYALQQFQTPQPILYRGICLTAHHPKGPVLLAYLTEKNIAPKRLFFFDDKLNNILSVQQALKDKPMFLHCFHIKIHPLIA